MARPISQALAALLGGGAMKTAAQLIAKGWDSARITARLTSEYGTGLARQIGAVVNRAFAASQAAEYIGQTGSTPNLSALPSNPTQSRQYQYEVYVKFTDPKTGQQKAIPVVIPSDVPLTAAELQDPDRWFKQRPRIPGSEQLSDELLEKYLELLRKWGIGRNDYEIEIYSATRR